MVLYNDSPWPPSVKGRRVAPGEMSLSVIGWTTLSFFNNLAIPPYHDAEVAPSNQKDAQHRRVLSMWSRRRKNPCCLIVASFRWHVL